jgi:hypothetical protein
MQLSTVNTYLCITAITLLKLMAIVHKYLYMHIHGLQQLIFMKPSIEWKGLKA